MFLFIQGVRVSSRFPCVTPGLTRFSLDLCRAVKKCRKCNLEVWCMGEGARVDCECIEFVMAGFFLFFFFGGGRRGPGAPCFSKTIYPLIFLMLLNRISGFTGWRPCFFETDFFFFF